MEALFNSISSMSLESARLAVNMVWLGLALTVVIGLLWRFARPGEAGVGYAAWWSVLAVVILLPLVVTNSAGRLLQDSLDSDRSATLQQSNRPSEWAQPPAVPRIVGQRDPGGCLHRPGGSDLRAAGKN